MSRTTSSPRVGLEHARHRGMNRPHLSPRVRAANAASNADGLTRGHFPEAVANRPAGLPQDETNSLGFDNDGSSLNASPLLVERWAVTAEHLVDGLFARLSPLDQKFSNVVDSPCTGINQGVDVCGSQDAVWYQGTPTS